MSKQNIKYSEKFTSFLIILKEISLEHWIYLNKI
jgi:hypothetical protein